MPPICGFTKAFTNYSENLFVEYWFGKKDAEDYVIGSRKNIINDSPIIGTYGANREGSGDMYSKGGNMLHTIRQIMVNNDEKWRGILQWIKQRFLASNRHDRANRELHIAKIRH